MKNFICASLVIFLYACNNQSPKEVIKNVLHDYTNDTLPPNCIIVKNDKFELYAIKDTVTVSKYLGLYMYETAWHFREISIMEGDLSAEYDRFTVWYKNKPYKYFDDTIQLKKETIELYRKKLTYEKEQNRVWEEYKQSQLIEEQINSSWPKK